MNRKEQLTQLLAQLSGNMAALTAAAEADNRALTDEEQGQFNQYSADFAKTEQEIANLARVEEIAAKLATPQPRVAQPVDAIPVAVPARPITGGAPVAHSYQNHGFTKGIGEYFMAVRSAKVFGRVDPRLMVNAVTTFGGETVGADGGYALPPQFAAGLMQLVQAEDSFVRALNPVPTNSNLLTVPTDEDPPWGTSGISAAKTVEGAAITASKPAIKKLNVVMHAIKALVHVSEESLSDIPFLASYVQAKMGEKLRWKVENYVVNGTGVDEPLGILNAPGLLSITDSASTATVIGAADVFAMLASALPGAGGFWLVSPTVMPQIWALKTDATAGYPLYTPDMRQSPEGALLGRPIFKSEAAKALNTTGDIMYVVPSGYVLAFNGGVQTASTIAFAFDQDLQSFRATLRMGGVPTLSAKVTRAVGGSNYASNLIALTGSRS